MVFDGRSIQNYHKHTPRDNQILNWSEFCLSHFNVQLRGLHQAPCVVGMYGSNPNPNFTNSLVQYAKITYKRLAYIGLVISSTQGA